MIIDTHAHRCSYSHKSPFVIVIAIAVVGHGHFIDVLRLLRFCLSFAVAMRKKVKMRI